MSAKLRHTAYPIAAVTATSAATGYPASNITVPSCGRPWRSTSTAAQNLDLDLGTSRSQVYLCVQGVNCASVTVQYGNASYTASTLGALTASKDRHGRRKFSVSIIGPLRYIRLAFSASAPDDSAAFYEAGAVFVFGESLTLPADPLLGSEASAALPQTLVQLPNGFECAIDRGPARQRLGLRFRGARTDDLDELARRARAGTCWLDLDVAANRELQWPVRHTADSLQRSFSGASQDEASIPLIEVA